MASIVIVSMASIESIVSIMMENIINSRENVNNNFLQFYSPLIVRLTVGSHCVIASITQVGTTID